MGRWIEGVAPDASPEATLSLDGYRELTLLRAPGRSSVYSAICEDDGRRVLAKVYRDAGEPGREARVEHELRLIQSLRSEHVVRARSIERSGDDLVLILDWYEGTNLAEHLAEHCGGQALALDEFFMIAEQLAAILAEVHEQRVIHRDIKPTNVLINAERGEVVLADFGISVLLEDERAHINDPDVLEGTLPYISPEQSGRTGASVDFRTDLYSLGVTFYELLTGQRPFRGESSLELLHAHLARRPDPPQWLRADIPTPLSELVMKLVEKAPERRYQSAVGLAADLRRLAEAWRSGRALDDFVLARDDLPITLVLPHRLYGREPERQRLLDRFRAAATGSPGFVLIHGPTGVGKSALLDELVEPVLGRRGFIARGGFERGKQQPFAALIEAISSIADQLLIETDERLALWRARLREGLAGLGGLIVTLVPKLGPILGEVEDDLAVLGVARASHRVALAFARLIGTLARPEHPLVLALDDLQWADPASCEVLDNLLEVGGLAILIVATTRERTQLEPGHGLRELLASLDARGSGPDLIELGTLSREALAEFVADVLALPPARVESLVAIIARKTGSNPFFVRQFLVQLTELGLLRPAPGGWTWAPEAIEAAALPEDSVGMMTAKIERLERRAQRLLTIAAVTGARFDADVIAAVIDPRGPGAGQRPVSVELQALVDEGLVDHTSEGFVFAHDRIREAAYGLSDRSEARELHLAIGRELATKYAAAPERVFEIADHLDRGHSLLALADEHGTGAISTVSEIRVRLSPRDTSELVELNLRAGHRALHSGATKTALRYLEIVEALIDDLRDPREGLRFEAELALAQAAGLSGDHSRAEAIMREVLGRELSPMDYAEAIIQRCSLVVLAGERGEALREGVEALARLGEPVPEFPGTLTVLAALASLARNLSPARLAALETAAPIHEPRLLAAMEIFTALRNIAYTVRPETWLVLVARQIALFTAHGTHPCMPLALTQGGLVMANVRGARVRAQALAAHCVELDVDNPRRHELLLLEQFVALWLAPWRKMIPTLEHVGRLALEAGDFENATFAGMMEISLSFYGGVHLRVAEARIEHTVSQVMRWGTHELFAGGSALLHNCRALMSRTVPGSGAELRVHEQGEPSPVDGDMAQLIEANSQLSTALVAYVFGYHGRALELLDQCGPTLEQMTPGTWLIPMVRVLHPLAAAGRLREADAPTGLAALRLRRRLRRGAKQLRQLCDRGCNFAHLAALLQAECHALAGELERAGVEFERAAALAEVEHHPMFEAIACERLAELAERRGLSSWMSGPARRARERYRHWGAQAKVAQLEARWPWLAASFEAPARARTGESSQERARDTSSSDSTSSTTNQALDVATIFKTWQAISTDIRLDEVVDRVMRIAVENAGADRGALILPASQGQGLELAAEINVASASASASMVAARAVVRASHGEAVVLAELGDRLPVTLLRWVARTREAVVLAEAGEDLRFVADPYVQASAVRSILCLPIVKHERLVGLLYLENKHTGRSFTSDRLVTLEMLMSHAASALEHARLYEALRASELRWRLLVDRLPDVVALLDGDGVVEFINLELDASARRAMLGQPLLAFASGQQRERLAALLDQARGPASEGAGAGQDEADELELELPGRGPRWYAPRVVPIIVDGRLERIIVVATDTTERRQRASEKAQLEAQLNQQQRLESIGTLAAGVAHEINNPIQGIMSYAELIAQEQAGPLITEFAGEIEHESKRVATIVRNLLAFSRQERDQSRARVEVKHIVEETLSLVRTILRRDQIGLDVTIADDLPELECRSQQIQQVIMNLVTNARDALNTRYPRYHEDKRIALSADRVEVDGAAWVQLRIEDRAGGVPEALVEQIFDPFFTTKGRDHGTGLGLSVSHGIVQDHGGRLRLENRPGIGACFVLELPVA